MVYKMTSTITRVNVKTLIGANRDAPVVILILPMQQKLGCLQASAAVVVSCSEDYGLGCRFPLWLTSFAYEDDLRECSHT